MGDDLKELLSILNAHKVRYLVVGAYAVSFHSEPRATKDMDVWIATDPANAASTFAALDGIRLPAWWADSRRFLPSQDRSFGWAFRRA